MNNSLKRRTAGYVMTLTIDRPERRNALNAEVIDGLVRGLQEAESDAQVRLVVLTGSGSEAFCAGADLGSPAFRFDYAVPTSAYANLLRVSRALSKPLLVRVNGACMAGGMGLLAMGDLALCASHAVFGLPEVKVGVFPLQVASLLQGMIPDRWLTHLSLTGESIDAMLAREIGLVTQVADDLDAATDALVTRILGNAPVAIRRGLYALKHTRGLPFASSIAFMESQIGLLALSEDAAEGMAAFREKRRPQWAGR
ncbi:MULTISPECIES: enoyl-CoA hydratase-related protein [Cupriavidus]